MLLHVELQCICDWHVISNPPSPVMSSRLFISLPLGSFYLGFTWHCSLIRLIQDHIMDDNADGDDNNDETRND